MPQAFDIGIIIPLLKDHHLDKTVADNYRGITLSSHVSKLFEMCMLQLGFKNTLVVIVLCLQLKRLLIIIHQVVLS